MESSPSLSRKGITIGIGLAGSEAAKKSITMKIKSKGNLPPGMVIHVPTIH